MHPPVTIRKATEADEAQVVAHQVLSQNEELALHPNRQAGEEIRGLAWSMIRDRGGIILVAETGGRIVGHVGAAHAAENNPFLRDDWQHYGIIFDLYVLPEYRRQQIGRALVKEMMAMLQASGATRIRIVGLANNSAALKLYEAAGFRPYEITMAWDQQEA